MKKIFAILLFALLLCSLAACGEKTDTPEPTAPEAPVEEPADPSPVVPPEAPGDVVPDIPPESGDIVLSGESYWVLEASEGDSREYVPQGDDLLTDLTLWEDGTARIREIEGGLRLVSEGDELNLTWTSTADGSFCLYTPHSFPEPLWTGILTNGDTLELERFGGTCTFRRAVMPEGGDLYSPAELQGVWMVSWSEVDGCEDDLSGYFDTMIFEPARNARGQTLLSSSERGGEGYITREDDFAAYQDREITLLDQPIYSGCGNEVWSVRVGEGSPLNEHGLPENVETYVTLLDQNTLLRQNYYSFDGGSIPGVSYRTYRRFLPTVSDEPAKADLESGDFELAGYMDAEGIWQTAAPDISGFYLRLEPNAYYFRVTADDGFDYTSGGGYWEMGRGGTLHMTSESNDEDWQAGAARNVDGVPEIYLWYEGGILRLTRTEDGDGSGNELGGYVDTMTDLEGRAFGAPENTLFVLYDQDYTDLSKINSLPVYEIDDGPQAQYMLVTSALDDNYFWLDEDGFCREDFGTVHAGESFIIRIDLSESGRYLLQIESPVGDYFIVLRQDILPPGETWNYFTT